MAKEALMVSWMHHRRHLCVGAVVMLLQNLHVFSFVVQHRLIITSTREALIPFVLSKSVFQLDAKADANDGETKESDLSWLKEAMGTNDVTVTKPDSSLETGGKTVNSTVLKVPVPSVSNDDVVPKEDLRLWLQEEMDTNGMSSSSAFPVPTPSFEIGLSGFAVDSTLGLVAVLSSQSQKFTFAPVSPPGIDNSEVTSPEALCLIQMVGGLDLGAAVFPPGMLARTVGVAVADANADGSDAESYGDDDDDKAFQLISIMALPALVEDDHKASEQTNAISSEPESTSEERRIGIQEQAPKVWKAVRTLPGLGRTTLEDVADAMMVHADKQGSLNDRACFEALLETLRAGKLVKVPPSPVTFRLQAVNAKSNGAVLTVDNVPPFVALGLSLRHTVPVTVDFSFSKDKSTEEEGMDATQMLRRFPAFRPVAEIREDAQVMDGFIPSMFFQGVPPSSY